MSANRAFRLAYDIDRPTIITYEDAHLLATELRGLGYIFTPACYISLAQALSGDTQPSFNGIYGIEELPNVEAHPKCKSCVVTQRMHYDGVRHVMYYPNIFERHALSDSARDYHGTTGMIKATVGPAVLLW